MILNFFYRHNAYNHVFFDLDRTLWDFEQNMRDALRDIFAEHKLDSIFPDSTTFIESFDRNNHYLWDKYLKGELSKDVLRYKRFEVTLEQFGCKNTPLAKALGEEYLAIMPLKTALVPGTHELLEYLSERYILHIISNGFQEVQLPKLQRSNIDHFFRWVITSEYSGYHKPDKRAFGFALSKANARKNESIMIGDDLDADILGAKNFGIDQIFYNPKKILHNQRITYEVRDLKEIIRVL